MLLLAVPMLSMRLGMTDGGTQPAVDDAASGVRPARRRVRSRLQRAAPARRRPERQRRSRWTVTAVSEAVAADAGMLQVGDPMTNAPG